MESGTGYACRPSDRRLVAVSTGTRDKRTAHAIASMADQLHARAEFSVLDAIADGPMTLLETYAEYRTDARLADTKRALDDVDLAPLVGRGMARSPGAT